MQQQLRIGLVMYGGLSLAIYMNGITQEILALVRASHARALKAKGQDREWVALEEQSNPYVRLLEEVDMDVMVDVISGTSAGGLNGLMLAKALACGSPDMGDLTELWLQCAQIEQLAAHNPNARALLSGDFMEEKLREVMTGLSADRRQPLAELVEALDLFVTATDLGGHPWIRRDGFGQRLSGVEHRYLFHLKKRTRQSFPGDKADYEHGWDQNDFGAPESPVTEAKKDRLLAKIGRATSAFPGIFPPIKITRAEAHEAGIGVLNDIAFDQMETGDGEPGIYFSDGGILVNKPFKPVLDTIAMRHAHQPVKRALIFLEPDPKESVPKQYEPHFLQAAVAGMTLPMSQDIREHLDQLQAINERRQQMLRVFDHVDRAAAHPAGTRPAAKTAAKDGGPVEPHVWQYYHLRYLHMRGILAGALTRAFSKLQLRDRTDPEAAVKAILSRVDGLSGALGQKETPAALEYELAFLDKFDTPYYARRVGFLLSRLHRHYRAGTTPRRGDPEATGAMEWVLKGLWSALEDLRQADWMVSRAGGLKDENLPPRWRSLADALDKQFQALAAINWGDREASAQGVEALVELLGQLLDRVRTDAVHKVEIALTEAGSAALPLLKGDEMVLTQADAWQAWDDYESHDRVLFFLDAYGEVREWDPVEMYRFSPTVGDPRSLGPNAEPIGWVRKSLKKKLSGEALGHLAAFFDERWRANDIMWGRLDAVDLLARLVEEQSGAALTEAQQDRIALVKMDRRRQILADFEGIIDLAGLSRAAQKYKVTLQPAPVQYLTGYNQESAAARRAVQQAASSVQPGGGQAVAGRPQDQVGTPDQEKRRRPILDWDALPDQVLKEYLQHHHNIGEETLGAVDRDRLTREVLFMMENMTQAVGQPGPKGASWIRSVQQPVARFLSRVTSVVRVVLTPREGIFQRLQENAIWVMTGAAAVLVGLQAMGWAQWGAAVWAVVLLLLVPQLFRLLTRGAGRWLLWLSGLLLCGSLGARILVFLGGEGGAEPLAPIAEWAARLSGFTGMWPFFAAVFGVLLVGSRTASLLQPAAGRDGKAA